MQLLTTIWKMSIKRTLLCRTWRAATEGRAIFDVGTTELVSRTSSVSSMVIPAKGLISFTGRERWMVLYLWITWHRLDWPFFWWIWMRRCKRRGSYERSSQKNEKETGWEVTFLGQWVMPLLYALWNIRRSRSYVVATLGGSNYMKGCLIGIHIEGQMIWL